MVSTTPLCDGGGEEGASKPWLTYRTYQGFAREAKVAKLSPPPPLLVLIVSD